MKNNTNSCYCCNAIICSNNKSLEHIIPSCIGGKLTSYSLLCKKCNEKFGENIDAELHGKTKFLMHQLMIKNGKNKGQSLKVKTVSGVEYKVDELHQLTATPAEPKITKISEHQVNIQFHTSTMAHAKQVLKGLKRSYPQIDIDQMLSDFKPQITYLQEPIVTSLQLGGVKFLLAVLKIAINYYLNNGRDKIFIEKAIANLKKGNIENICNYFINAHTVYSPIKDEISHLIVVKGCSKEKIIYAYVELFNTLSSIILLSDDFTGSDFEDYYCFDLLEKKEKSILINYNFKYSKSELCDLISTHNYDLDVYKHKLARVMEISAAREFDSYINISLDKIFKDIAKKYKTEKYFTPQMVNELSDKISKAIIMYNVSKRTINLEIEKHFNSLLKLA